MMRAKTDATGVCAGMLLLLGATTAVGQIHADLDLHRAVAIVDPVPVRVLELSRSDSGVTARLLNTGTLPIVAMQVVTGESLADERFIEFMGVASEWLIEWSPGQERVVRLLTEGLSATPVVRVRAVVMADGSAYGDARVVKGFRRHFTDLHAFATDAMAILDVPVPASEGELQALSDRVAQAAARAPASDVGDESGYVIALKALERLQGRDMAGTPRLGRELDHLRSVLRRQRDAARRFPLPPSGR
jgi:hypothetical protein